MTPQRSAALRRRVRTGAVRPAGRMPTPHYALGLALLGFLLGRAPLLGLSGCYSLALVAALRAGSVAGAWPAALGSVVGLLTLRGAPGAAWSVAALAVAVLSLVPHLSRSGAALGAALAAAAGPIAGVWVRSDGLVWTEGLRLAAAVALTGALAHVLERGLVSWRRARLQLPEGEALQAAVALALGAITGLQGLTMPLPRGGYMPLDVVGTSLAVMVAAWAGGPLLAAATGLLLGVAGLLAGADGLGGLPRLAVPAVALGVSGGLAGCFRALGRPGVVLAYGLAYTALAASQAPAGPGETAVAVAAAALGLLAVPARWGDLARRWVAGTAGPPAHPGWGGEGLPPAVATRVGAVAAMLRDVEEAALPARSDGPDELPLDAVLGQVVDLACDRCALHNLCWVQNHARTRQAFAAVWQAGRGEGGAVPTCLQEVCRFPRQVLTAMAAVREMQESDRLYRRRVAEARRAAASHMANLAEVVERLLADAGRTPVRQGTARRLAVRHGVARLAKRGSLVCGDSFYAGPVGEAAYALILSDGMGAGREAARESQRAVRMVQRLLAAGCRLEPAVQAVNAALLVQPVEDWFATLDVAFIDLVDGRVEFAKLGAAPSLIRRHTGIQIIRAEAPPAGVLHPVVLEPEYRVVRPGDWLVMATDGLWETGEAGMGSGHWLLEFVADAAPPDPAHLAEAILARALAGAAGEPADDMTVLVAHVAPA